MDATFSSSTKTNEDPEKARRIADILGDPDIARENWKEIMAGGVICSVTIRRKRLAHKLTHKELGLALDQKTRARMDDIFTLGMKNLLPAEVRKRFERIDDNARNILSKYGIRTGLGVFVPYTNFREFREAMRLAEEQYFTARDEVFANYGKLKRQVEQDYAHAASHAYNVFAAMAPEELSLAEQQKKALFTRTARRRIKGMFPSEQAIRDSFVFDLKMAFIDLSLFAGGTSEDEAAPSPIAGLTMGEFDSLRWEQKATSDKNTMMAEMTREVVREARRKKRQQIDSFLGEVVGSTRMMVYESLTTVLASVTKNDYLHPKSTEQLRNVVDMTSKLQFYPDQDMDTVRAKIQEVIDLGGAKGSATVAQIRELLQKIAVVMRATYLPLADTDRDEREDEALRIASLGVITDPSPGDEREARKALGMRIPAYLEEREEREDEALSLVAVPAGFEDEPEEREL